MNTKVKTGTGVTVRNFADPQLDTGGLSVNGKSIKFEIDNTNGDRELTFGVIPRVARDAAFVFDANEAEDIAAQLASGKALNLMPGTYTMPKANVGDPTKTCVITDLTDKGLGLNGFRSLLALGSACVLTYGKIREVLAVGEPVTGQVEQPFYEVVSGALQTNRDKVNVTVLKGQELDKDYVLGPFRFDDNYVVGGNVRGLEYTVQPGAKVIVEIWYANMFTMADFLGKYLQNLALTATMVR